VRAATGSWAAGFPPAIGYTCLRNANRPPATALASAFEDVVRCRLGAVKRPAHRGRLHRLPPVRTGTTILASCSQVRVPSLTSGLQPRWSPRPCGFWHHPRVSQPPFVRLSGCTSRYLAVPAHLPRGPGACQRANGTSPADEVVEGRMTARPCAVQAPKSHWPVRTVMGCQLELIPLREWPMRTATRAPPCRERGCCRRTHVLRVS